MACSTCHRKEPLGTPKVLYWDTENSPSRGYFYGKKWETNIQWEDLGWKFLMYSYAWNDEPIKVVQSWNEKKLVKGMWKLLDEADIVVIHNASFDLGHFYAKCLQYGLPPPRPFKTFCTLLKYRKLAKGGFQSNSLDDLADALGIGRKKELPKGFWRKYLTKDPKYVKMGISYAKQDIYLLRRIHKAIEPFVPPIRLKELKHG